MMESKTYTQEEIASRWGEIMTEEYAAGADDVEVMAALGLSRATFQENYQTRPVFRRIVDIGRLKSSAFWRGIARKNLYNKAFNTQVWMFTMKNREGWAEKSESVVNDVPNAQKSLEELRQELLAQIPGAVDKLGMPKLSELVILPEKAVDK